MASSSFSDCAGLLRGGHWASWPTRTTADYFVSCCCGCQDLYVVSGFEAHAGMQCCIPFYMTFVHRLSSAEASPRYGCKACCCAARAPQKGSSDCLVTPPYCSFSVLNAFCATLLAGDSMPSDLQGAKVKRSGKPVQESSRMAQKCLWASG